MTARIVKGVILGAVETLIGLIIGLVILSSPFRWGVLIALFLMVDLAILFFLWAPRPPRRKRQRQLEKKADDEQPLVSRQPYLIFALAALIQVATYLVGLLTTGLVD